jgi:predicted dinucleotide-binding enzyme
MSSISVIGLGNMAGAAPAGDIVVLAVPYTSAAAVVSDHEDALNGEVKLGLVAHSVQHTNFFLGVSILS